MAADGGNPLTQRGTGGVAAAIPSNARANPGHTVDPIYAAIEAFRRAHALFFAEYVDDIPDEIASILLAWLTFYGSALASAKRAHIGCPELVALLPPKAKIAVRLFAEVFTIEQDDHHAHVRPALLEHPRQLHENGDLRRPVAGAGDRLHFLDGIDHDLDNPNSAAWELCPSEL